MTKVDIQSLKALAERRADLMKGVNFKIIPVMPVKEKVDDQSRHPKQLNP